MRYVFGVVALIMLVAACGGDGGGGSGGGGDGIEAGSRPLTLLRCGQEGSQCAVVLIGSDGGDAARVTDWVEGGVYAPVWFPDGRRLAFSAPGEEGAFVTHSTEAGTFDREELLEVNAASWSQDRSRIAYLGESGEVYVADGDGANSRQLTADGGFKTNVELSPDGTLVLYTLRADTPGGGLVRSGLWVAASDGSDPVKIAEDVFSAGRWSPEGDRILFAAVDPEVSNQTDLYTVAADGSGLVNLTNEPALYGQMAWSPDGKSIAFSSDRESDGESFGTLHHVFVMDVAGGDLIRVTGDSFELRPAADPIVWSPDGTAVAFTAFDRGATAVVAAADGSGHTRLTFGFTSDQVIAWTEVSSEVWPSAGGQSELETYVWELERVFGRAFDRLTTEVNPKFQEASEIIIDFDFADIEGVEDIDAEITETLDEFMPAAIEALELGVEIIEEMGEGLEALDPPAEVEAANDDIIEAMRPLDGFYEEAITLFESVETLEDIEAMELPDETAVNEVSELLGAACMEIQRALDEDGIPISLQC